MSLSFKAKPVKHKFLTDSIVHSRCLAQFFAIGHKWQHKCDKWTESQNNTVTTGGSGQLQLNKLSKFFRFFSFPILEGRMINCAWTMLCFYTTIKLGSLMEFPADLIHILWSWICFMKIVKYQGNFHLDFKLF